MTNRLSLEMLNATRLTRAGRLVEATEFLQQLLRGESPPAVTDIPSPSPDRPDVDLSTGGGRGGAVVPHLQGLLETMKRGRLADRAGELSQSLSGASTRYRARGRTIP